MSTIPSTGPTKLTERHRNIFNGDANVFFYNPEKWQPDDFKSEQTANATSGILDPGSRPVGGPFKASAIHRYVDVLADSGIDTFLVNANACRAWYPSKVVPTILDGYVRGDRDFFRGHAICQGATESADVERFIDRIMPFLNLYQDLVDAGVDWLAEAAGACRRRGVSPWVSIRMNDFHGHKNIEGSFFNTDQLKDPAMRLSRSSYSPTMFEPGYRGGLNYEQTEVREQMFLQIKEVVEDYDYEGLELDWWRQPLCCEPNATQETIDMMTAWFREVRALTERRAQATGRPYPLGMRISGHLDTMKTIGIDVETLCREGVIDFVGPSGFWCTSWEMPHDELRRRLGDRVTIYGNIENGANLLPTRSPARNHEQGVRYISSSPEMLRANAAGKLVLGADGIEWFNFYCTDQGRVPGLISDYTALHDIHDLDWLRGQPKHYTFSLSGHALVLPPFEVTPQLPVTLEKWWNRGFRLPMCAEPTDRDLELVVQIVLRAENKPEALPVAFNGCWPVIEHTPSDELLYPCGLLTHLTSAHHGYNYHFPVNLVRDGWNEITVENGGEQPITIASIEIAVRPKRQ